MITELKATIATLRAHLDRHPHEGRADDPPVRVHRTGPLAFEATDDAGHVVASDMPALLGGAGSAMTPGTLLRSALGCCEAVTVAIEAAARGIDLSTLEVKVTSTSDRRGLLDVGDDVLPGPSEMQLTYHLASDTADAESLRELVDYAHAHSPVLTALCRSVPVQTAIEFD